MIPPHADSFCRKVCPLMISLTMKKIRRLMLILFAERFAALSVGLCWNQWTASCWFFLQKGLLHYQLGCAETNEPPHADSFCRKVCVLRWRPIPGLPSASCWFFLQKGLRFQIERGWYLWVRLMLILFAERFASAAEPTCKTPPPASCWFFLQKGLLHFQRLLQTPAARLMLILFAERFARYWRCMVRVKTPPHADSFCRKVCFY